MISCCKLASLSLSIVSSSEPDKLPIKFNYSPNGTHLDLMFPRVYCIPPRSLRKEYNKSRGCMPTFCKACYGKRGEPPPFPGHLRRASVASLMQLFLLIFLTSVRNEVRFIDSVG